MPLKKIIQHEFDKFDSLANDISPVFVNDPVYKTIVDEADASNVYVGQAAPGSATSDSAWRIKKINVSGSTTTITWAFGSWDNRATLSYN